MSFRAMRSYRLEGCQHQAFVLAELSDLRFELHLLLVHNFL